MSRSVSTYEVDSFQISKFKKGKADGISKPLFESIFRALRWNKHPYVYTTEENLKNDLQKRLISLQITLVRASIIDIERNRANLEIEIVGKDLKATLIYSLTTVPKPTSTPAPSYDYAHTPKTK